VIPYQKNSKSNISLTETGFVVEILLLTELYGLVAHNMFKTSHTKYCCKPVFLSPVVHELSAFWSADRSRSFLAFPNARYVIICRKTVVCVTDLYVDLMNVLTVHVRCIPFIAVVSTVAGRRRLPVIKPPVSGTQ